MYSFLKRLIVIIEKHIDSTEVKSAIYNDIIAYLSLVSLSFSVEKFNEYVNATREKIQKKNIEQTKKEKKK